MEPTVVLGVQPDATDDEIRAAYLSKVQEHPPDRSPEQFELIRDAYESLRDPRRRLRQQLFVVDPTSAVCHVARPGEAVATVCRPGGVA